MTQTHKVLAVTILLSGGMLTASEYLTKKNIEKWVNHPKNQLALEIKKEYGNKLDLLQTNSLNSISNDQLKKRLARIQTVYNSNHKPNHLTMAICAAIGGIFSPIQLTYAMLAYATLECLYTANTGIMLAKGNNSGLFEPTKYENFINLYLSATQVLTVISPAIFLFKYKRLSTALAEMTPKTPPAPPQ